MKKEIILIKFGGSLITDKTKINAARYDVITNLVDQIKSVESEKIIIATGAGGYGHPVAKKYESNLSEGKPFIIKAVKEINNIIVDRFNKAGMKALTVEPSKISKYSNGKIISLLHGSIVSLLEDNVIPVFHADLVEDLELGTSILSMDKFLIDVAISLKNEGYYVKKVIFCGTTDGVFDGQGRTIEKINKINIRELDTVFYDNKMIDISGGMRGKVEECLRLADENISCMIINGQKENNLINSILGKEVVGTSIKG